MALKYLDELIKKLNSPYNEDGEEYESLFDFDYEIDEEGLHIFDKNEVYSNNYAEDLYFDAVSMYEEYGEEFNLSKPRRADYDDEIFPQIQEAVKKDGFGDLDWEDNARLICVKNPVHDAKKLVFNVYQDGKKISSCDTKNEAFKSAVDKDNVIIKMERVTDSLESLNNVDDILEKTYEEFKKCYKDGEPEYSEQFYNLLHKLSELAESSEKELIDYFIANYEMESAL